MKAIVVSRAGPADVLEVADVAIPVPGPDEALVRHEAIGLNFIDIYFRTGLYPVKPPYTPGGEAAGIVEAVGDRVSRVKPGDRVAYAGGQGAYAEFNVVDAGRLVLVPKAVSSQVAAAALLKGMTTEFLANRICPTLTAGDWALVHAAAGGVGGILVQWLKHRGLRVIGAAGGPEKTAIAKAHGAEAVIDYDQEDLPARVRDITAGQGVRIVYDSVGKATFEQSLASVGRRGMLVCFGNASGPPPAIEPGRLQRLGSLFLTRPTLFDYVSTPMELDASATALFNMLESGAVKIAIGQSWPLDEARKAHEALETRATKGVSILIP
jgi:NADPH2:quinone reductase